jgi:hypothetical protein
LSCFRKFRGVKIHFHRLGVMCSNPHRLGVEVDFFLALINML